MEQLQFGDFTGDGVTDVLAVVNGRWAISESARGPWQRINPNLGDAVDNLFVANKHYAYEFLADSPEFVLPSFAFAGRFGAADGGGTLVIDPTRIGQFHSKAEIAAGAAPDWRSLFPY